MEKRNVEKLIYNDDIATLNRIFDEYPQEALSVLCPVCQDELVVVLNISDVKNHGLGPGIYCKRNHLRSIFNLRT